MMRRMLAALQSTAARVIFLVIALGLGVWAVVSQWDSIVSSVQLITPGIIVSALALSLLYVIATFLAWRILMNAQHTGLGAGAAARVFFVSQLGKYLPGGIWNIVAAAELGKDHAISRIHSVVVMLQSTLISISTGLILGTIGVLIGPAELRQSTWWVVLALPVFIVVLLPPVMSRLTSLALKKAHRGHLEVKATWRSIGQASLWSIIAWLFAGGQVWVLGVGLGLEANLATLGLCVLAYALAWTVGFLVVVAPAGVGIREGVLGLLLAGYLSGGATVALVLLSRVALTVADIVCGVVFLRGRRRQESATAERQTPSA